MQTEYMLDPAAGDRDFAALLDASLAEEEADRGDIVTGTALVVDNHSWTVDLAPTRAGTVPRTDPERMGVAASQFPAGKDTAVMTARTDDEAGNLVLSVSQAPQSTAWKAAEELM